MQGRSRSIFFWGGAPFQLTNTLHEHVYLTWQSLLWQACFDTFPNRNDDTNNGATFVDHWSTWFDLSCICTISVWVAIFSIFFSVSFFGNAFPFLAEMVLPTVAYTRFGGQISHLRGTCSILEFGSLTNSSVVSAAFWSLDLSRDWHLQHFGAWIFHAHGICFRLTCGWFTG